MPTTLVLVRLFKTFLSSRWDWPCPRVVRALPRPQ